MTMCPSNKCLIELINLVDNMLYPNLSDPRPLVMRYGCGNDRISYHNYYYDFCEKIRDRIGKNYEK